MRSNLNNASTELLYTTVEPSTPAPGGTPPVDNSLKLLNSEFQPVGNKRQQLLRNITRDCAKKQLIAFSLCFWNTGRGCEGQNHMVLSSIHKPQFSILRDLPSQNAYHEYWLNETLPWIWMTPVDHFYGVFKPGFLWAERGLTGPICYEMYVQKLPTSILWEVSQGDYNKTDESQQKPCLKK